MAETVRTQIFPADIDAQGNVVIWDHGPLAKDEDHKEWHRLYGDGPAPMTLHASDAARAISLEPKRYALDPRGVDSEVDAEVKKIQEARAAAKKHSEEYAVAAQLAVDRKTAHGAVMARRNAAAKDKTQSKADEPIEKPAWYRPGPAAETVEPKSEF